MVYGKQVTDTARDIANDFGKRFGFKPDDNFVRVCRTMYAYQVAAGAIVIALESNDKPLTQESTAAYTALLNGAIADVYNYMRNVFRVRVGKTPARSFNPAKKCDDRCRNARGYECECPCGGLGHGMNYFGRSRIA